MLASNRGATKCPYLAALHLHGYNGPLQHQPTPRSATPTRVTLLQNDSLPTLLARLEGILGPVPRWMVRRGRYAHRFYTKAGILYERSAKSVRGLHSDITLGCCTTHPAMLVAHE